MALNQSNINYLLYLNSYNVCSILYIPFLYFLILFLLDHQKQSYLLYINIFHYYIVYINFSFLNLVVSLYLLKIFMYYQFIYFFLLRVFNIIIITILVIIQSYHLNFLYLILNKLYNNIYLKFFFLFLKMFHQIRMYY